GLEQHITLRLPIEEVTPAVSQGAIGCCSRADDAEVARWMKPLDDVPTRLATTAERALLRRIEGGCQVPLGALARPEGSALTLYAAVCAIDGSMMFSTEESAEVSDRVGAAFLGVRIAEQLLAQGAGSIIEQQRGARQAAEPP